MKLNKGRIWLGGLAGGVVWTIWSFLLNMKTMPYYEAMQKANLFLKQPRYPGFTLQWILMLFFLSILLSHLYAWSRATAGPGFKTAFMVGAFVGFASGFPMAFAQATWSPIPRVLPLAWMLELWAGAIFATIVAGWLYKEP